MSDVSVVVVSRDEGNRLEQTVEALVATADGAEIIVVDDQSSDASTEFLRGGTASGRRLGRAGVVLTRPPRRMGVAGARNFGAHAAAGRVLVFSDAHVIPSDGWLPALCAAIDGGAAAAAPAIRPLSGDGAPGYGFTWRDASLTTAWLRERPDGAQPVPMLCGCFLAVAREPFLELAGFDEGLITWGLEDAELSLRLWRTGHRCVVTPDADVRHLFRPRFPYPVDWRTTLYNVLRLAVVHFGAGALARVVEHFRANAALPRVYGRLVDGDVWLRREQVDAACVFDAAWFFDRFAIAALQ